MAPVLACSRAASRCVPYFDHLALAPQASGATPLIVAATNGRIDVVQGLINQGANVNAVDADGYSPLMWACFRGHEEVGGLLCDAGADVNLASQAGNTALIYAAYTNLAILVKRMLALGASPQHNNNKGLIAADVASQQGHASLAAVLLPAEDVSSLSPLASQSQRALPEPPPRPLRTLS